MKGYPSKFIPKSEDKTPFKSDELPTVITLGALLMVSIALLLITATIAFSPRDQHYQKVPKGNVLGETTRDESFLSGLIRTIFSPLGKFNQWLIQTSDKNATEIVDPLTTKELNEIFELNEAGDVVVKKKLVLLDTPISSLLPTYWVDIKGKPHLLSTINKVEGVSGNLTLAEGTGIDISNDKSKNTITISSTGGAAVTGSSSSQVSVNLTAGTGISIASDIVSNTNLGSSQSIFKNVAVSGQSTVVADGNNDTLTFAAGAGIAITTSASNDRVTIASTGGAVSFDSVTAGTNTNALVVGTGGSLSVSGTGTIAATSATDLIAAGSVVSDAEVDNNITVAAAGITGSLTDAQVSNTLTASDLVAGSSVIADAEVDNNLTIDGTGSVTFGALTSYPAACGAGNAITALADSPTCSTFWYSGNDGAGSGLDADLLDGSDSTAFSPVAGSGSIVTTGALTSGSIASGFGTISTANSISGTVLTATTAASGLVLGTGVNATTLSSTATAARAISFPDEAGTVCTTGSVCTGYQASGSYVPTTRTLTAGNGLSGGGDLSANRSFDLGALTANWDQTGAFDISLNNANSELRILESAGATFFGTLDVGDLSAGRTYTFPNETGTVCTTGSVCSGYQPAGSGGVSLAPGSADADSSANSSIWINDTGGGNLLELEVSGTDTFVVDNGGNLATNGNLSVGMGSGADDDYIYFDTGASEFIMWDDAPGEFDFSDDVNISGSLTFSGNLTGSSGANSYSFTSTATTGDMFYINGGSALHTSGTTFKLIGVANPAGTTLSVMDLNPAGINSSAEGGDVINGLYVHWAQGGVFDTLAGDEHIANITLDAQTISKTDNAITAGLLIHNNDTATGNQLVITDGIKFSSAAGDTSAFTNYINSTNFVVTSAGTGTFAATTNPGLTVGNGTIGYLKVGGSTISDPAGDLTLDSNSGFIDILDHVSIYSTTGPAADKGILSFNDGAGATTLNILQGSGLKTYGIEASTLGGAWEASAVTYGELIGVLSTHSFYSNRQNITNEWITGFQTGFDNNVGSGLNTTLTNYAGLRITDPTLPDADLTITNPYGIYIEDFSADNATFTNGPYAIYQVGTNDINVFAGNTMFASITADFAGGVGVLGIANAGTNPTGTPTGGGVLYASAGDLFWRDDAGVDTQLNSGGGSSDGWHGSTTRIKIMPGDFKHTGVYQRYAVLGNGGYEYAVGLAGDLVATVPIPTGMKATHVRIYTSVVQAAGLEVFECDITTTTCTTKGGPATTASELDITDVNATTTNYLSIWTLQTVNNISGGYVTIAPQ